MNEPVAVANYSTVISVVVAVLASIGVHASTDQIAAVASAVGVIAQTVGTVWARSKVTPMAGLDKSHETF